MRLKDLAEHSGCSAASIKYYLREGLLPPGRRVNATLAEYDEPHLERLRLIKVLRDLLGLSVEQIRQLAELLDDEQTPLPNVLGTVQLLALGLCSGTLETSGESIRPEVDEISELLGWSKRPEAVRAALSRQLERLAVLGVDMDRETLIEYGRCADQLAQVDIAAVDAAPSRDAAALTTAVGVYAYRELFSGLLAVAQASHALLRSEPE